MADIQIKVQRTGERLDAVVAKQMPFALANALNLMTLEIQQAERAHVRQVFRIRKSGFIDRLIKIKNEDRATKGQLRAGVRVEGPETASPGTSYTAGSILAKHEFGGTFVARAGSYYYVPTDEAKQADGGVPLALYPKNLRLLPRHGVTGTLDASTHLTKRGKLQYKGKRRTFIVTEPGTPGAWRGIVQRGEGKKRSRTGATAFLWDFVRTIHIRPRLQFFKTAEDLARQRVPYLFSVSISNALRTAR